MAARLIAGCLLALWQMNAWAGQADVLQAQIQRLPDGSFSISATLRHADSGWNHYADRFEILDPRGAVLAKRVLRHPHVAEQPFTRQLQGVRIQSTDTWIKVRAHDALHGYGGREVTLSVPH